MLLDNMSPEQARRCVEAYARSTRSECTVEISGGITLDNARAYALRGRIICPSGALTHSARVSRLSLLVDSIL